MPKIVEQAPMAPGQCLFSQDINGPWLDTEVMVPWHNPYGYISLGWLGQMARDHLGMVDGREVEQELEDLRNKVAVYAAKTEQLKNAVAALKAVEDLELEEGAGI